MEYGAGSGEHEDKQSQCRRAPILGASDLLIVRLFAISLMRRGKALPGPWGQTQWMAGQRVGGEGYGHGEREPPGSNQSKHVYAKTFMHTNVI